MLQENLITYTFSDGVNGDVGEVATRLFAASVDVEIEVSAGLDHTVACNDNRTPLIDTQFFFLGGGRTVLMQSFILTQQQNRPRVRVHDVDEFGVGGIEADVSGRVLEIRFGRIQS